MSDFKTARRLSFTFFVIGTVLITLYYFTLSSTVAFIGYAYTGIALLVGVIYVILVGFKVLSHKMPTSTGLKCGGIVALNLPIAALYMYFVLILMTTVRLTLENTTGHDITEASIGGCLNRELGEFKAGESKTIWITVKNDCSLVLFYKMDREPKVETPFDYLTNGMGMVTTYKIGSNKEAAF